MAMAWVPLPAGPTPMRLPASWLEAVEPLFAAVEDPQGLAVQAAQGVDVLDVLGAGHAALDDGDRHARVFLPQQAQVLHRARRLAHLDGQAILPQLLGVFPGIAEIGPVRPPLAMTILRGGGGSTNNTYVAISAAGQRPRIQTQATSARLPRLRRPAAALSAEMRRARPDLLSVDAAGAITGTNLRGTSASFSRSLGFRRKGVRSS